MISVYSARVAVFVTSEQETMIQQEITEETEKSARASRITESHAFAV